ncbi:sulfurtransferase [Thalassotalea maritima]|uniref:sulfurtransferase n=1 Tax=Thalassotalea maritima TaxID=3242416 RepID=UPI0035271FBB
MIKQPHIDNNATKPLVSVAWLHQHLDDDNVLVIECDMNKIIGIEPLVYQHKPVIPGAYYVNVEIDLCDSTHAQLHKMASTEQMQRVFLSLGIDTDSVIVLYDAQGIYSAPRAWWTFKCFGFQHVYVLNGGLPAWLEQGLPTSESYQFPVSETNIQRQVIVGNDEVELNSHMLIDKNDILPALNQGAKLVDVRSKERFYGQVNEPRPGVRSGHIPGAQCLPFTSLLANRRYIDDNQLDEAFSNYVDATAQPLIFSCGSGITACIVMLVAWQVGLTHTTLYDGSWAEWGSDHSLPIATA